MNLYIGLRLDAFDPISFKLGMMIDTTKFYSVMMRETTKLHSVMMRDNLAQQCYDERHNFTVL